MMFGGAPFVQNNNPQGFQMYEGVENSTLSSSACPTPGAGIHSQTLWYNLSVLRDKVQQVQSLVSLVVSPDPIQQESIALAASGAAAIIIVAASSKMYALQHAAAGDISHPHDMKASYEGSAQPKGPDHIDRVLNDLEGDRMRIFGSAAHYNAADLLAKYTNYYQVCGKGFKRVANLRMHMRAHGDEYKTNAALCNPMMGSRTWQHHGAEGKYSCPLEGCRWSKNHAKLQPLKSVIYVSRTITRGATARRCVCVQPEEILGAVGFEDACTRSTAGISSGCVHARGTTFSRNDKLMGHVSLLICWAQSYLNCFMKQGNIWNTKGCEFKSMGGGHKPSEV